jgi:preprotein translocase subunit SecG
MSYIIDILLVIEVLVSFLMILVVLMQRPKSEGLGAAFGGGMTENLFGAQTTNVLQKFTRNLGIAFFLIALVLSILYSRGMSHSASSLMHQQLSNAPAPKPLPEGSVVVPPGGTMSAEDARKFLLQKINDAQQKTSGTAASPETTGTHNMPAGPSPFGSNDQSKPADTPASDIKGDGLKLQVATPAPDKK